MQGTLWRDRPMRQAFPLATLADAQRLVPHVFYLKAQGLRYFGYD